MSRFHEHLDPASWLVLLVTLALFVVALFVKGLGHDLLLEAGVFLVSVKLILMMYKSSVTARHIEGELADIRAALARLEAARTAAREGEAR
jgi:Flp pilus assembly protein TadB